MASNSFFADLKPLQRFEDFHQRPFYQPLPGDWGLALVDISGSTQAIAAGHYRWVNAVGVAALAALRNALAPVLIPYQFGGDGATVAIPLSHLAQARQALRLTKALAHERFKLDLRIGVVAVSELQARNLEVMVAKYQADPSIPPQTLFMGSGIAAAEKLLKDPTTRARYDLEASLIGPAPSAARAFAGFECRWQPLASQHGEVISLIVQALSQDETVANALLAELLATIRTIYHLADRQQPIAASQLRVATAAKDLAVETMIRTFGASPWRRWLYRLSLTLTCLLARPLFKLGWRLPGMVDSAAYQAELLARTDHQKFDGTLRILLDGTAAMRQELTDHLTHLEGKKLLRFGLHVSDAVVITCLVEDRQQQHFHFVDGANGGYTAAAMQLKSKALAKT